ncbi:hypothetical protein ADK67_36800 [Saccharothrix sp. NRRL B-16348]|nr:hypothetical protein ADK67_36800 [Saccharothrix sp. NRRL B-16348]
MERMNLRPQDLLRAREGSRVVPTFADFVPRVVEVSRPPSRRVYGTYWDRLVREWGPRRLDEPTPEEVSRLFERARETAVVRRSSNGGLGSALHTYYALGAVYRFAVAEGLLSDR